jgi:hypothetical protein
MKKLLLSSALLVVCSMSAMDDGEVTWDVIEDTPPFFRLATAQDDLTPTMQSGLAIYNSMVDKLPTSAENKERLKKLQSHVVGYVQAMANAGNPQWPLVLVNEGSYGFSALEIVDQPKNAIALHMTPLKIYGHAEDLLAYIRDRFPNTTSIVTRIGNDAITGGASPLKGLLQRLGFKPCDDYTPNSQLIWNPKDYDAYQLQLTQREEEPWDGRGISPALMEMLQEQANDGK